MSAVTRQEVSFGMQIPEGGDAHAAFVVVVRDVDGHANRFSVMGQLPGLPAGPINVAVEASVATMSVPAKLTLRDRLAWALKGAEGSTDDQVNAVLEMLVEQDNLLDQLDEVVDDGE